MNKKQRRILAQINVLKQTELLGRQFEVYGTPQEPLFVATDVAKMIEHTQPSKLVQMVEEDEKLMGTIFLSGQNREVWLLTENGLYEVLMQSRKPIAKQFKKGVKAILKEIRTNGGYISNQQEDTPEMIMARALQVAQSTIERHQQQLQAAQATIATQSQQLQAEAPKVAFANAILASKTSCLIGELAKIITQNGYPIGQNRLFGWMRNNGYLAKSGERRNLPNQQYIEQGLFEIKKGTRSGNAGVLHITTTTKVTPKGQAYFIDKFMMMLQPIEGFEDYGEPH